jgi:hypothetical protein
MKRAVILLAVIFAGVSLARGQSAPFIVNSRIDGVKVYIDSVAIGSTPLSGASISPGNHVVRYCHPDTSRWPVSVVVETLNVTSSTPVERTVTFPAVYHFTSEPYGAAIRIGDSTVGTTPMYYAGFLGGQVIVFSKPGYDDGSVLASAEGGEVYCTLSGGDGAGRERSSLRVSDQSKSLVPIIVASGTAVISGSMAAYFKIKADKSYDEYVATGNPGALTRVDTFDKYSAVALVASQLSVIALSYLLLSK